MRVIENKKELPQASILIVAAIDTLIDASPVPVNVPVNVSINGHVVVRDFPVTLVAPEIRPWDFDLAAVDPANRIEIRLAIDVDESSVDDPTGELTDVTLVTLKKFDSPMTVSIEPSNTGMAVMVQFFAITYFTRVSGKDSAGKIVTGREPEVVLADIPATSLYGAPWSFTWNGIS